RSSRSLTLVAISLVQYLLLYLLVTVSFSTDPSTTEIYTLSLHDALPICSGSQVPDEGETIVRGTADDDASIRLQRDVGDRGLERSEEHTSELQSHLNLVCRLLLEKKNR